MIDWSKYPNFDRHEFDSPDRPGSGDLMDEGFLALLQEIRTEIGMPMSVTSGYRTRAWNDHVGGKPNSAHLRGFAADIACGSSVLRHKILEQAYRYDGIRVGIANTFIHLDIDPSLPQDVTWTYGRTL